MQYTDNDILTAVKRGERCGYEALVARYGQIVFTMVMRIVGDEARAEELTQDTFIKFFETIDRYDSQRASLSTWLCRIAYRLVVDKLRRRHLPTISMEEVVGADADDSDDFLLDETEDREAMLNLLDQAVHQLPIEEQNLLTMFYYEHQSIRDISFIVGAKESTVKMRLHRIRKKLYEIMTKGNKNG